MIAALNKKLQVTKDSGRLAIFLRMDNLQVEAYEVHRYLYENPNENTAEAINNKMPGKSETSYTLIEIFKEHSRKVDGPVGLEFAPATCKRYQISLQHTRRF